MVGDDVFPVAVLAEEGASGLAVPLENDRLRGTLDDLNDAQGLVVASVAVKVGVADFKLFIVVFLRFGCCFLFPSDTIIILCLEYNVQPFILSLEYIFQILYSV